MARSANASTGANLGFEADMFRAADKLRGNMEPSDYKHVALGLIFLKHISDSFEALHADLMEEDPEAAEDRTSIWRRTSSGCRRPPAGPISAPTPSNPTLAA